MRRLSRQALHRVRAPGGTAGTLFSRPGLSGPITWPALAADGGGAFGQQ